MPRIRSIRISTASDGRSVRTTLRPSGRVSSIEPAQIRGLADIADDHDRSVRGEYRGAGYWQALGRHSDGEAIDDGQEIHEQEA
jgi:hypothetical protein